MDTVARSPEVVKSPDHPEGGFSQIQNRVLLDPELSPQAKAIFGVLLTHEWKHGKAEVRQDTLALESQVGKQARTARRYLRELEKHDPPLIAIERQGLNQPNIYRVAPEYRVILNGKGAYAPIKKGAHAPIKKSAYAPSKNTEEYELQDKGSLANKNQGETASSSTSNSVTVGLKSKWDEWNPGDGWTAEQVVSLRAGLAALEDEGFKDAWPLRDEVATEQWAVLREKGYGPSLTSVQYSLIAVRERREKKRESQERVAKKRIAREQEDFFKSVLEGAERVALDEEEVSV